MGTWQDADGRFRRAAAKRGEWEAEEIAAAIEARQKDVHRELGFGSFFEYVESVMQVPARTVVDRMRVIDALEKLPRMRAALADGTLKVSAVRELVRVATADTEGEWLEAATGRTVREVEKLVSGHRPGDGPDEPPDPSAMTKPVVLELSGAGQATLRALRNRIDAEHGEHLDDDAFVAALARAYDVAVAAPEGKSDDGAARYQVAVTTCEMCERTFVDGGGQVFEVDTMLLHQALCDAEHVRKTHVGHGCDCGCDGDGKLTQDIPKPIRRAVKRRDHHRCRVPGCRNRLHLEIHHLLPQRSGGGHALWNLLTMCQAHHRAHHTGRLVLLGDREEIIRFFHPDGTAYGAPRSLPTWAHEAVHAP